MKNQLIATAHVGRKFGPFVTLAASAAVIAFDLVKKTKQD